MKYSVCLISEKGKESYLSVKGHLSWKTKRIAKKHADDCRTLIAKGRFIAGIIAVDVENEFGEIVQ